MVDWSETNEESKKRWETNADFWDGRMGNESNRFHREIVRPDTEKMLSIKQGDKVLDIACGNGNFSKRLAELGAEVTAFDYSGRMIENAMKRCSHCPDKIDFHIIDAACYIDVLKLKNKAPYDKAVSNMAVMDISDIVPLFKAVSELLKPDGIFVFSSIHPCFQSRGMRKIIESEDTGNMVCTRHGIQVFEYSAPCTFEGIGIIGQPVSQLYYHRPLNQLFNICFDAGFTITGFSEPVFDAVSDNGKFEWDNIPPAIIVRLQKCA